MTAVDRRSGRERARDRIRAGQGETFGDTAELLASDREAKAALRRRAKAGDAKARKEFAESEAERKAAEAKGAKAARAKAKGATARRARRRRGTAKARKTGRKARSTVRKGIRTGPVGSFAGFFVWSMGLLLLYRLLVNSDRAGGPIGGLASGVQWLGDPNRIIEFGGEP